ncbi:MAG: LysR family transcriptional regulator [Oscillospiraceae bacterium]|nr:LysR family transcriptional regulator [Oscillospiraceae bacterium]
MEQDMKYIFQVYQDGSFSAAAEHLFMSQPALSIAVKRVEDSIGAEIFDRSRRPLTLTEAGRAYIDTLHYIRYLEEDLSKKIEDLRGLQTGSLRLGGTHFLNCYILAPILAGFARLYPGIQLDLFEDSAVKLQDRLQKREMDLTLSCAPEIIKQFEHKPAFYDHVLLAIHEEIPLPSELDVTALGASDILKGRHLEDDCPCVDLAHFKDVDFILLRQGNNLYNRGWQMFEEAGFTPKVKMSISQMVTSFRLADNGLGAAFISDRLVRSKRSRLRFYKIQSEHADRLFYFLLPKRDYTPFAVRRFIEYASENIPHPGFRLEPDSVVGIESQG